MSKIGGEDTVSFVQFVKWFNDKKENHMRNVRRKLKEVFESIDEDGSGSLNKEEFAKLARRAQKSLTLSPPFDIEKDWDMCDKVTKNYVSLSIFDGSPLRSPCRRSTCARYRPPCCVAEPNTRPAGRW